MQFVVQRVLDASVIIDNKTYSSIDKGLLVLIGISKSDRSDDLDYYVKKIINMRIFNDYNNKMNQSVLDINGSILLVSQFTLLASTKKGNRPSYIDAAEPEKAKVLYREFYNKLKNYEINVKKAEVDRYYETNKDSYVRTEPEIHARHILVSSFRDATGLRAALREGADFSQLAHQHSEDLDTYYVGGDLGLFNESTEPILWMACMSLKLNTVSSPIQTDYGYHIIEVLAKYEEGSLQKINEIEEQITEAVVWQKHHSRVQKLIASLKKNSDWVIKDLP